MNEYLGAQKNSILKVSFKHVDEETLPSMLNTLAWQWTIGNIDYEQVKDILLGEDTYVIPNDRTSRLVVVAQRILGKRSYDLNDERAPIEIQRKGKVRGCYVGLFRSVNELPDQDLAIEFIERLEQVETMWAKVESGKDLPEKEPKPDKSKKPTRRKATKAEQSTSEGEGNEPEPQESKSEDTDEANPSLYQLWGSLEPEVFVQKLEGMRFSEREELIGMLCEEFRVQSLMSVEFLEGFAGFAHYMANAINDLDFPKSSALPKVREMDQSFLDTLTCMKKSCEDSIKAGQPKKPQPKKDSQNQLSKEERGRIDYLKRATKRLRSQTRDKLLLEILDDMAKALEIGDLKTYEVIKAEYDTAVASAGHQQKAQNSEPDQPNSKSANDFEPKPGSGAENTEPEEDEPVVFSSQRYTATAAIDFMKMVGVEVPKALAGLLPHQTIQTDWFKEYLESQGYTGDLPE